MRKAPFLRFTLFLIGGVVAYIFFPEAGRYVNGLLLTLLLILAALHSFYKLNIPIQHIGWASVVIDICFLLAGYSITHSREPLHRADHLIYHDQGVKAYKICITDNWQSKPNSFKTEAKVLSVYTGDYWKWVDGRVHFSIKKDSLGGKPKYKPGDILMVSGSPRVISENHLPGGFDFKVFSKFKRIYHQSFTDNEHIIDLGQHDSYYFLKRAAGEVRTYAQHALEKYLRSPTAYAMISALVLGVKDNLSDDMVKAFSDTGAMHVLAVSGLHVGIVYLLLSSLFKPWENNRKLTGLLNVFAILVLWTYAFVTGLSPSVLRAVLMFTVVLIGKVIQRKGNVYNSLAISAFILILFEPYLITSVGFQLSYLAVLGIVYLQPRFQRWWEPSNKLFEYIWSLTCVALAAQLSTSLLGLLYFHQFPTYFFLSNLIVIPLSGFLLGLGLAVVVFSKIPFIASIIALALDYAVDLVVFLLGKIASLPLSVFNSVYLSPQQTLLLYAFLITAIAYFHFGKIRWLYLSTLLIIGYTTSVLLRKPTLSPSNIQIYALGEGLITSYSHESSRHLKPFDSNKSLNIKYLNSHFLHTGTHDIKIDTQNHFIPLWDGAKAFVRYGKTIILVDKMPRNTFSVPVKADVIIISKNYRGRSFEVHQWIDSPQLVIEGYKIPYYWRKEVAHLMERGSKIHLTQVDGILNL